MTCKCSGKQKHDMQIGRASKSIRIHIKSRLEMDAHVVSKEVTK